MSPRKARRAAIYVRVSTDGQSVEKQLKDLWAVREQRGWSLVEVYSDKGLSGTKDRSGRPALDRMLRDVAQGRVDVVMAWALDRLGRSLYNVMTLMEELEQLHVGLYLHKQAIDSTTAAGRALLGMAAVFAQFERDMLVDRVHAGLRRARAQGKKLGRPRVGSGVEASIQRLRRRGSGVRAIATELHCGVGTVLRVINAGAE